MTPVAQEMFENVGIVDAASPGAFSSVSAGTFYKRPVGPRLPATAAPGWSADVRLGTNIQGIMQIDSGAGLAARDLGMAGCWVRFKTFPAAASICRPLVVWSSTGANTRAAHINVSAAGLATVGFYQGSSAATKQLALDTWYYFAIAWKWNTGNILNFDCYAVAAGEAFAPFGSVTTTNEFSKLLRASFGTDGGAQPWSGRIGGCGIYSLAALNEAGLPADMLAPVENRHVWVLDSVNGNDSNTGLEGSPWLTAGKFSTESQYAGLMDVATGFSTGDVLVIDTRDGPFTPGLEVLQARTRGLTIRKHADEVSALFKVHVDLLNASFVKTPGYTNIYEIASSVGSVIWEDDKWLDHKAGASFAAVAATLDATAGSFHTLTDGSKTYFHPFGSTNPISDGKTYTRSVNMGGANGGSSVVELRAADMLVSGLECHKTTLSRSTDKDPYFAYFVIGTTGFGGTSRIENVVCSYTGKHAIGYVDSVSNSNVETVDCVAEQCTPYAGNSPFVSFNGGAATTGNVHIFRRCTTLKSTGSIGSAAGVQFQPPWLTHNSSGSNQYSSVQIIDCNFPGGGLSVGVSVLNTTITGTSFGHLTANGTAGGTTTVERCFLSYAFVNGSGPVVFRNCIIAPTRNLDTGWLRSFSGTLTVEGCTFDLSGIATSSAATSGLLQRGASLTLVFRNNALKNAPSKAYTVLENAVNTDTLTFDHNAYQFGAGTAVMKSYNDGSTTADRTFTQWQALGKDADSFTTADLLLGLDFTPLPDSPAINAGLELGSMADYTGLLFPSRNDIGALEARYFSPSNDQFAESRILTGGGFAVKGSTLVASLEPGEVPHNAGDSGGSSVWYSWHAPRTGRLSINLSDSSRTHVGTIYTGSTLPDLSPVANFSSTGTTECDVTTGTLYHLAVDSKVPREWGSFELSLRLVVNDSYETWRNSGVFGPSTPEYLRTEGADADSDGLLNGLEYMLGFDPEMPSRAPVQTGIAIENGHSYVLVTFDRRIGIPGLVVQSSSNLQSWDTAECEMVDFPIPNIDGMSEKVTFRLIPPFDGQQTFFVRLIASSQ